MCVLEHGRVPSCHLATNRDTALGAICVSAPTTLDPDAALAVPLCRRYRQGRPPGRIGLTDAIERPGLRKPLHMSAGTKDDPWQLSTAPGTSAYTMYVEDEVLVCVVGSTTLRYQARAIEDLAAWLRAQGDWVDLGAADELKPAAPGTVEAWGRAEDNPVGGWYGLRKGYRGRFGMYLPPLLEAMGVAELTHEKRNNRMRAVGA